MFLKPGAPIPEPPLWFHDIFRTDGTPFDRKEVEFIKEMTRVPAPCDLSVDTGRHAL